MYKKVHNLIDPHNLKYEVFSLFHSNFIFIKFKVLWGNIYFIIYLRGEGLFFYDTISKIWDLSYSGKNVLF